MKIKLFAHALTMLVFAVSAILSVSAEAGETWMFSGDSGSFEKLSETANGQAAQDISTLKQLVNSGNIKALDEEIASFKKRYPDIAGEDFDSYIEGERYYAKEKWSKAVKAYDKFLDAYPLSMFREAALERQLSIATAYLNGEKRVALRFLKLSGVDDGVAIAHGIADRVGNTRMAQRALLEVAESHARRKKFQESYEAWTEISSRWATGQLGDEALIQRAYTQHSAYNGFNYDSTGLTSALSFYKQYRQIHPEQAVAKDVDQKIRYANEQLAHKEFGVGEYYNRTDRPEAAKMYYEYVIENWPDTGAAKAADARLKGLQVSVAEPVNPNKKPIAPKSFKKFGKKMFDRGNKFLDSWPDLEEKFDRYLLREEQQQ